MKQWVGILLGLIIVVALVVAYKYRASNFEVAPLDVTSAASAPAPVAAPALAPEQPSMPEPAMAPPVMTQSAMAPQTDEMVESFGAAGSGTYASYGDGEAAGDDSVPAYESEQMMASAPMTSGETLEYFGSNDSYADYGEDAATTEMN